MSCAACGRTRRADAKAASAPAASPMFRSTGCSRWQPLATCVVLMFLHAGQEVLHPFEHGQRDPGLVAQARYGAVAGIQFGVRAPRL